MSFIGEAALSAFFDALFGKLTSSEFKFATNKQVGDEIERWERTLKNIQAVLADAEEKQMQNQAVKLWLATLKDLAYDVDDILDEFATEALQRNLIKHQHHQASTSRIQRFLAFGTTFHPSTLMFNNKMISKMKEITEKLDALAAEKGKLQLRENDSGKGMIPKRPPSSSLVKEGDVYGRKEDKEKILNLLLRNDDDFAGEVYSVIPIVGMGGIGKTTLAQLVYNDDSIKDHFDLKAWVCVSDEFDIINVTKTILLSVDSEPCDLNNLNLLQVKLKEKLSKKKFLLVLDDVWNENYEDWSVLRCPLDAGLPGSKIIVTTRSSNVSSIMRTVSSDHLLQKLSDDDSLCMFARHALGAEDFSGYPDLKEIGLEIMKKCDGLPLATKTVGGLLRTKLNREAWKDVLGSEIWNSTNDRSRIIPALWLSYYHLPSQLKQCFAYCSLVPKDYEFKKEEMVLLWMAEGFLHQANTNAQSEDLGRKCFEELVSRSFFQVSTMNRSKFIMHDLINDLAQSVAGEFSFRMERHGQTKFAGRIRHSSYVIGDRDGLKKFETLSKAKHLRTFLPFMMMHDQMCYLSNNVVTDLLPKLRRLRVLSLERYYITEIPESFGDLIHLRYLNFSYTMIKGLPNSICNLYNLETLILRCCKKIEKLPSKIETLVNLCHLDIKGSQSIKEMPSGIGKLTNLRVLSDFIVGQEDGLNIREMQNLSNLRGKICISNLQNVDEAQAACEAGLSSKPDLDILEMRWCADFNQNSRKKEVEREVLQLLEPHTDLKVLTIQYYAGTLLPSWIGEPSFKTLWALKLEDCQNCTLLPTVGKLPLLKDLYIKGMSSVITVGNEFYGENWQNVFPSLETLYFKDMSEWKEWNTCEVGEQGKRFPHLRELYIHNCPKLVGTLLKDLHSLAILEICYCQESVVYISNLPRLHELEIKGCKEVVFGSCTDLWSVKNIQLRSISKFACEGQEAVMAKSVKVENLWIHGRQEPASLWQTKWGQLGTLRSLRTLHFVGCQELVCIGAVAKEEESEGLSQLEIPCKIEYLRIAYCKGLEKLSKTFSNLTCLRELKIEKCPKLVSFCVDNLPPTIRNLEIENCESLQCLLDDGKNINFSSTCVLESLKVDNCGGLKSLSTSGKFPAALKSLDIKGCPSLEVIGEEFGENMCLERIRLSFCENIKYLPQGLHKLCRLQEIDIGCCPSLICFPESGLPTTPNFKSLTIINCEKLEALPILYSLQLEQLEIGGCYGCPRVVKSIPEGRLPLPTTLLKLDLWFEPNVSEAVMKWGGLQTLTSLTELGINGGNCTYMMSFPLSQKEMGMNMNMKLPSSLTHLTITEFKNLRKLSANGFENLTTLRYLFISDCPKLQSLPQNLTSLQSFSIWHCPKLKSLPKKEMLPSLLELSINDCPKLKKRCKRDKGKLWSYVSHIPNVEIE